MVDRSGRAGTKCPSPPFLTVHATLEDGRLLPSNSVRHWAPPRPNRWGLPIGSAAFTSKLDDQCSALFVRRKVDGIMCARSNVVLVITLSPNVLVLGKYRNLHELSTSVRNRR